MQKQTSDPNDKEKQVSDTKSEGPNTFKRYVAKHPSMVQALDLAPMRPWRWQQLGLKKCKDAPPLSEMPKAKASAKASASSSTVLFSVPDDLLSQSSAEDL